MPEVSASAMPTATSSARCIDLWTSGEPDRSGISCNDTRASRCGDRAAAGRRSAEMAVDIACARRLFTVEEYHRMAEVGILKPHDRVELIRGEIVEMSPIGRRHAAFVDNLNQLLVTRLAGRAIVSVQNPVVVSADSE